MGREIKLKERAEMRITTAINGRRDEKKNEARVQDFYFVRESRWLRVDHDEIFFSRWEEEEKRFTSKHGQFEDQFFFFFSFFLGANDESIKFNQTMQFNSV